MAKEKVIETTIRELCNKIASHCAHLLVCDEDAVVIYQDLIGHATVEENRELANDPALMETFYRIYGVAYGTVAAIKFYLNNSDKIVGMQEEIADYKQAAEASRNKIEELKRAVETQKANAETLNNQLYEAKRDMEGVEEQLAALRQENIELKAKLYDML